VRVHHSDYRAGPRDVRPEAVCGPHRVGDFRAAVLRPFVAARAVAPPISSRWRCVLPELAGIGATPAARARLAAVAKRWAPAISPTSLAAVSGPKQGSVSSCGAI
jgi:hypothetical protein